MPNEPSFGWCAVHGVRDCLWEHPNVAQVKAQPEVTQAGVRSANDALNFARRAENNSKCTLHPHRIQLASQEAVDKAGIDVRPVGTGPIEEAIQANGELTFDPTRVASLSAPIPGRIWRVEKNVGETVSEGEVLALIDAADVGKAKTEFLQALAQVELKGKAVDGLKAGIRSGSISDQRIQEAEAALKEAQYRLVSAQQALVNLGLPVRHEDVKGLSPDSLGAYTQFLGLPASLTRSTDSSKRLDPRTTTANLLPIKAPFAGTVVSRKAVIGEIADATKALFVIADPQRIWLTLNVRQDDLKPFKERDPQRLLLGRIVRFRPDGTTAVATGTISWVAAAADEKTRTLQVRADLPNPGGWLRANTFGAGTVVLREEKDAVVIPSDAIHWEGNCNVVFVMDRNFHDNDAFKVFHTRIVRPGVKNDGHTEIIAGLLPGEVVATTNSGVLRAELLRASLGEG
jgi:cobalt-zinc-cadmium efflux system membrane fusion protein